MIPAEQIAFWADRLRDMAAGRLQYSQNIYDHERYSAIQQNAIASATYNLCLGDIHTMTNRTSALLALEDGTTWPGTALGTSGERAGEVIFNTAMTGYQEVLTDPSYYGQIVVMTAPHIDNTGVNMDDEESIKP